VARITSKKVFNELIKRQKQEENVKQEVEKLSLRVVLSKITNTSLYKILFSKLAFFLLLSVDFIGLYYFQQEREFSLERANNHKFSMFFFSFLYNNRRLYGHLTLFLPH
jgi:hypothetical protein